MNWTDILTHLGITQAIFLIVYFFTRNSISYNLNLFWWAVIGMIAWPSLDLYQHWPNPLEAITHAQSLLEWLPPVLLGWFNFYIMFEEPLPMDGYDG